MHEELDGARVVDLHEAEVGGLHPEVRERDRDRTGHRDAVAVQPDCRSARTAFVTPCRVSSPSARTSVVPEPLGTASAIGSVSVKVACGKAETSRAESRKYESRCAESVAMSATCTVIVASVIEVPSTRAEPVTLSVRPVTVTSEPLRTSWTR